MGRKGQGGTSEGKGSTERLRSIVFVTLKWAQKEAVRGEGNIGVGRQNSDCTIKQVVIRANFDNLICGGG